MTIFKEVQARIQLKLQKCQDHSTTRNYHIVRVKIQHLTRNYKIHKWAKHLKLCVPCIITNYVNGPTRCTFSHLFILQFFMSTLHVSNDRVVHHQELIVVYCITQLCTILRVCPAGQLNTHSHDCTELCNTAHYDQLLMMNDSIVRNM